MNQFKIPILSDAEPPITNEPISVDPGVIRVSLEVNYCPNCQKDDCQKKECECKDCYGDDCKCGEDKCCIPCKCEKKEEVEPTCFQLWFPKITLFRSADKG